MNTLVFNPSIENRVAISKQLAPFQVQQANPYVQFSAKHLNATLLIYTSGKIVIQGSGADTLARFVNLIESEEEPFRKDDESTSLSPMIGTDEVGNGSYFGGIAVVASFVSPDDFPFLKSLGVDDSKRLTDHKIQAIAPLLEKKIPHQSLLLKPSKYNQLVGDGLKYNAVSVKVALHNQAIFLLLKKGVTPKKIIIDAFTTPSNYRKYVTRENNQVKDSVILEEKAESKYLAVAVSSIIARALFLENLKTLGQEVGYQLPSGASTKSDHIASKILAAHGMSGLEHTAKLHFANTKKAQLLLKK